MKKIIGGLLFICLFVCSGCSEGLFSVMGRIDEDPFEGLLDVKCFEKERSISLSWAEDPGADEYILKGAPDNGNNPPNWVVLYRGRNLSFEHTVAADDEAWIYTLSKVRGSRLFDSRYAYLGVGSDILLDTYEPNDNRNEAQELLHIIDATMQYYRSYNYTDYGSMEYGDSDWYYVTIPPLRQARIQVEQDGVKPSGKVFFSIFEEQSSLEIQEIGNEETFTIKNNNLTDTGVFRFRLSPDNFLLDPSNSGGSSIHYTLTLTAIELIPD